MLGFKSTRGKGALAILAASALLLSGCAAATTTTPTSTSTGETGTTEEVKKLVIGFSEPLAGQAWRETGLAALMAIANRPEYKDRIELKIVRTNDNDVAQQNAAMLKPESQRALTASCLTQPLPLVWTQHWLRPRAVASQ